MTHLIDTVRSSDTLRSAARFMAVGMLGTLIDFSIFAVLNIPFGVPALLANTLSYSAGIINNYLFHRYWTFTHRPRKAAGKQFSQFMGVSLTALAINNLILLLLAAPFSRLFGDSALEREYSLSAVGAKMVAILVGLSWNFIANHLWTFRATPE